MTEGAGVFRFTPHWTDILRIRILIPAATGLFFAAFSLMTGKFSTAAIVISSALAGASLLMLLQSEIRRRRTAIEVRDGLLRYVSPSCEKTLAIRHIDRVETGGLWGVSLPGAVRLTVYSQACGRAWLSVRLHRMRLDEAAGKIMPLGETTGGIVPGGHSALIFALTSERTTLLLVASAFFTVSSGGSSLINALGLTCTAAAALHVLFSAAACRRLSLSRRQNGFVVTAGFGGGKKTVLHGDAVSGAVIRRSPVAALCGFGSVSLITVGGALIPCACRVNDAGLFQSALKLLGAEASPCSVLSGTESVRKTDAYRTIPASFAAFLSVYFSLCGSGGFFRLFACLSGTLMSAVTLRCIVGFLCGGDLGMKVSPSVVLAGGMNGCCPEYFLIRRGNVSEIRISSGILRRMNGLCSARAVASGKKRSVRCRCVSYGALNGFASRFCS